MENKELEEIFKELWGEDLYNVFSYHIDKYGRLTSDWAAIIENEVPKYDENYNDNPLYKETYTRMYMMEFDELENGTLIRPR